MKYCSDIRTYPILVMITSQSNTTVTISFATSDTGNWVRLVSTEQQNVCNGKYEGLNICIDLTRNLTRNNLTPVHLVTLACLIQTIRKQGLSGHIQANEDIISYLRDDLHLNEYFSSEIAHIKSESHYNLNLWKVSNEHALMYSQHVADYLKRTYFDGLDLSTLKVVLDELYANIADHSESNGIAYSFIRYDENKHLIRIAFCDFGIGIKSSLLKGGNNIKSEFIRTATMKGVTAGSNTHNRGFGLDTVVSSLSGSDCAIKILSGNELFISNGDGNNQRTWLTDFNFAGTLIYFDMPISSFEEVDYMDNFEL